MRRLLVPLALAALAASGLATSGCDSGSETCEGGALQVQDLVVGGGTEATAASTVTVDYVGRREDGSVFDQSAAGGATFPLPGTIPGFQQGIAGMRVGGQRRLTIPPDLAYGAAGVEDQRTGDVIIPPCETLTFEVTLRAVA